MSGFALAIVIVSAFILPVHLFGLYILVRVRHNMDTIQILFLFSLTLAEFQLMLCSSLTVAVAMTGHQQLMVYLNIYGNVGNALVYYCVMVLMTVNRFMELFLHLRYHLFWNLKCSKIMLALVWGGSLVVVLSLMITVDDYETMNFVCFKYFYPICDVIVIIALLVTYSYISSKIYSLNMTARHAPKTTNGKPEAMRKNALNRKRKIRKAFIIPALVFATFAVFIAVPDLYFWYQFLAYPKYIISEASMFIIFLSYHFALTSDIIIYIFLSPPIRKYTYNMFRHPCACLRH